MAAAGPMINEGFRILDNFVESIQVSFLMARGGTGEVNEAELRELVFACVVEVANNSPP